MPNLDAIFFPKGTPAVREKNEAATPFQGLQGHLILPIRLRICGGFCTVKFDFEEIKLNIKIPYFAILGKEVVRRAGKPVKILLHQRRDRICRAFSLPATS